VNCQSVNCSAYRHPFVGVAESMSANVGSVRPVPKKKEELVRRRSSDGFTMLLHCQSRLEKLYNQTLRTQVHFTCSSGQAIPYVVSVLGLTSNDSVSGNRFQYMPFPASHWSGF